MRCQPRLIEFHQLLCEHDVGLPQLLDLNVINNGLSAVLKRGLAIEAIDFRISSWCLTNSVTSNTVVI